ncbi:hypothetical protein AB6A40_003109, partial [Gnathostoma spinigerum]
VQMKEQFASVENDNKSNFQVVISPTNDKKRPDLDDLMDEGVTDAEGHFFLKGHEREIGRIEPKLNVYHDCNDENTPCLKKFSIFLPKDYVFDGEEPGKVYDAKVINLAGQFSGETRDCLN